MPAPWTCGPYRFVGVSSRARVSRVAPLSSGRTTSVDLPPSGSRPMIRVEVVKWGQTPEDLRLASVPATPPGSGGRFQALYLIASGQFNATACAAHIGRQDETVLGWIHRYNESGPDALTYHRTGGRAPFLTRPGLNRSLRSSRRAAPSRTADPVTAGR